MPGIRLRRTLIGAIAASSIAFLSSTILADIPVEPRPPAPAPVETTAPLKVTIVEEAGAQATLVIPRQFAQRAIAAAGAASATPANSSLIAIVATVAGGGALSIGALLLGIYLIRRSNRRAPTAVAGTVAAIGLFVGAGFVFADLIPGRPLGPIPDREDRIVRPGPDSPQVKIVIVDEGDTIELTLPRSLVNAAR
jgi:hypothetical protein